ncbi:MAG: PqqD family protein [Ruminiclostridium sp.]|nr:PqqD family protein [Ruminiclostridium sp.]
MKKKQIAENYLDKRPVHADGLKWSSDGQGMVILDMENKGAMNRIAQKLLKKPKISHIHLDEMGSFVWPLIDGERTITDIGVFVKEHFGEKAEPLYERLAQYFKTLETNGFIRWHE